MTEGVHDGAGAKSGTQTKKANAIKRDEGGRAVYTAGFFGISVFYPDSGYYVAGNQLYGMEFPEGLGRDPV